MSIDRSWMWRRFDKSGCMTSEFEVGVIEFLDFAYSHHSVVHRDQIRCPCSKCCNKKYLTRKEVHFHLKKNGFERGYTVWIAHGESYSTTMLTAKGQSSRNNNLREGDNGGMRSMVIDNVSEIDVFDRTHKRQKGLGDFVDSKSKRVRDVYEDVRSQIYENDAPIDQFEFDPTSWVEAAGGTTKGYVYGFGSHMPANEVLPTSYSFSGEATDASHSMKQFESRLDRVERKLTKIIEILKKLSQDSGVDDLATCDFEPIDGSFRD